MAMPVTPMKTFSNVCLFRFMGQKKSKNITRVSKLPVSHENLVKCAFFRLVVQRKSHATRRVGKLRLEMAVTPMNTLSNVGLLRFMVHKKSHISNRVRKLLMVMPVTPKGNLVKCFFLGS